MKCCGEERTGNFCNECGESLNPKYPRRCKELEELLDRFLDFIFENYYLIETTHGKCYRELTEQDIVDVVEAGGQK